MKIITILSILFTSFLYSQNNKINTYKYGFIDVETCKEITPLKYDTVWHFRNGAALVKLDGKYGSVDREGKEIVSVKYDAVVNFGKEQAAVMLNEKYGIVRGGKEITEIKYDEVYCNDNGLSDVRLDGKYGIVDSIGKEIIAIKYDYIFIEEHMVVVKNGGKYGAFDFSGIALSPLIYDTIWAIMVIDDDLPLYVVGLKGKYGLVNDKFEKITDLKYDKISSDNGAISVAINYKYGFLNREGMEVTEIKYEQIGSTVDIGQTSISPALLDNKWSFFDVQGKEVFPVKYDSYNKERGDFSDLFGTMKVKNNNKWGCINENLVEVIPPEYDEINIKQSSSSSGPNIITVKLDNKWGVFDMMGNKIVPVECDEITTDMYNIYGLVLFKINGKWGICDATKVILTAKYQEIKYLWRGLFSVKINGKWGVNDGTKEILTPKYQEIQVLRKGLFTVKINDKWGVNNAKDEIVIPAKYDEEFLELYSEIIGILKDKKIVFNFKGKIISKEKIGESKKDKSLDGYMHQAMDRAVRRHMQEVQDRTTSDLIKVKKNDTWILINNEYGEIELPMNPNHVNYPDEGIATVKVKIE